MAERPEVFLSHATPDLPVAQALVDGLDDLGVGCFLAPRDLGPGANFAVEIVSAISGCEVLVVLLSRGAVASPHVRREVSLAVDERRTLLPLAMPGTSFPADLPAEWTYWLSAVQITDFPGVDAGVELVRAHVRSAAAPVRRQVARASRIGWRSVRSSPSSDPGSAATPSALLRAEARAVPLIGRDAELARLEAWATRDGLFDARLITGAAGQGKSRLAMELADRLAPDGWEHRSVRAGEHGAEVVSALGGAPTLLVVDYAETRVAQLVALVESLADQGLGAALRLLLLARGRGDWWARLTSASAVLDELLAGTDVLPLPPLTEDDDTVVELYRQSYRRFAAAQGLALPGAAPRPGPGHFASTLAVLEMALSDVLDLTSDGGTATHRLASRLLGHERRYIQAAAAGDGLDALDATELDRCAGVLTMFGARDEASAAALLRTVVPDVDGATLRRTARLYRRLYPGSERYLDGLRPDSLAEDLVVQLVEQDGGLPGGEAAWSTPAGIDGMRRALAVVAGAAARDPALDRELARVLDAGGSAVEAAAVDVATHLPDPAALVAHLQARLALPGRTRADAAALLGRIPEETIALADLAADLGEELIDSLPPTEQRDLADARVLLDASNRSSDAGRTAAAIASVEAAVEVLEGLADADPEAATTLGVALSNLSNRRWETGLVHEALPPAERSVEVLTRAHATGWRLAAAHHNHAFRLLEAGRWDEAEVAARQAGKGFEAALADGGRAAEQGLAAAGNNLVCLAQARGDWSEGERLAREAVTARRGQAGRDRDRFLPYVARTLANGASAAALAGDAESAAARRAESVNLHALVAGRAPIFQYEQAVGLVIGAVVHALNAQPDAALADLEKAERIASALPSQLGALRRRTLAVLRHDREKLRRGPTPDVDDVSVAWDVPTGAVGRSTVLLPLLLEFKDL